MTDTSSRNARRHVRQRRARVRLAGSAERPRLSVFRSLNHIYAQVIDDQAGRTLAAASSRGLTDGSPRPADGESGGLSGKQASAQAVGAAIAAAAQAQGVRTVVFDRAGYPYHGRVKALAEAARAAGLQF